MTDEERAEEYFSLVKERNLEENLTIEQLIKTAFQDGMKTERENKEECHTEVCKEEIKKTSLIEKVIYGIALFCLYPSAFLLYRMLTLVLSGENDLAFGALFFLCGLFTVGTIGITARFIKGFLEE
ncbi:MAG: hypothetical protein HUJ68_09750 [Clostridia bacterium]|nr:hypothetical protein [Clostridia bacterium]